MGLKEYRERVQAEKRATLLIAAREAFLEQGYGRVTVASIAKRAGTSLATLYKHYDGKASLFIAVIENLSAGLVAELSAIDLSGLAPAAALLQLGRLYGRLLQRPDVAAL
ncbi:MAG: helix-turn-helix domain-containing protein, partial [Myxococcota bacterium]